VVVLLHGPPSRSLDLTVRRLPPKVATWGSERKIEAETRVHRSELFHVGMVVRDLEEGRQHLASALGIVWGPIVESNGAFTDAAGNDAVFPLRVCYSTAEPYLELVEEIPGTEWVCNPYSNLHHIGYWSDAIGADSEHLTKGGCPLTLSAGRGAEMRMAY